MRVSRSSLKANNEELKRSLAQANEEVTRLRKEFAQPTAAGGQALELPAPDELLNQLRSRLGRKSKATLADVTAIIELLQLMKIQKGDRDG